MLTFARGGSLGWGWARRRSTSLPAFLEPHRGKDKGVKPVCVDINDSLQVHYDSGARTFQEEKKPPKQRHIFATAGELTFKVKDDNSASFSLFDL
jgi:hypothetical protein